MEIFQNIDIASASLGLLAVVGVVNVISLYNPDIDSRTKFLISLVVAIAVGFIPAELGNEIATRLKDAITLGFAATGTYKIATKAGGR